MNAQTRIATGTYLLGKTGAVRKVGDPNDFLYEYLQFHADGMCASSGFCMDRNLKQWGTIIDEAKARRLVPNMDEQLKRLKQQDAKETAILSVLLTVSDTALIAELEHRGYRVGKRS